MPFVQAKCPECGGMLAVDDSKKAAICQFCGNAFIVEEAVNNYITYNITNNTTNNVTNQNFGAGAVVNIYEDNSKDFEISGGVLKKYNGSSLTPVVPEGVVVIEGGVFAKSMITEVTLPSTLKELRTDYYESPSYGVFQFCEYLEKVNLAEGLRIIGERSFCRCERLKDINIPRTVEVIGEDAFFGCNSIKEITIPDSVTSIGRGAFQECISINEITIPDSVTMIDKWAFNKCENLAKVIIEGDTLKGFENAFWECRKLETVLYKKNEVLVNPIERFENIIKSPFWHWKQVENAFFGSIFYDKYCNLRNKEKRCSWCGADLSKRLFSNEYYCKNCSR